MTEPLLKHSRLPRKYHPRAEVKATRDDSQPVAHDRRALILEDAKQSILAGERLDQIAAKYGIARRTLQYWLAQLGDEYEHLRKAWIDSILEDAGEELEVADDPLRLARARELWKRATWYAERRDRARYGQINETNVNVTVLGLDERLRRARDRVVIEQQSTDAAVLPASDEQAA